MQYIIDVPDKLSKEAELMFAQIKLIKRVAAIAPYEIKTGKTKEQENPLSIALKGKPLTVKEFTKTIKAAEQMPTLTLNEARKLWATKEKKLQILTK